MIILLLSYVLELFLFLLVLWTLGYSILSIDTDISERKEILLTISVIGTIWIILKYLCN